MAQQPGSDQPRTPNFVVIFCDDLGYGDLGCYGSRDHDTPRLDRMAAEGTRFTNFYVPSPVCSPSRAGLLTGCYPKRVGLDSGETFVVLLPGDPIGLSPDEVTIPSLLRGQGYATKIVGKWHLGDQPEFLPDRHGFDDYFGLPYSNDMLPDLRIPGQKPFPPLMLMRQDKVVETDPNQVSLTDRYLVDALRFIHDNRDRPFFLYLAHMYVHVPIYTPMNYHATSRNGPYGAAVSHLDFTTGAILDTLRDLGLDDNTIVLFTSDNGAGVPRTPGGVDAMRLSRGGVGSNRPLRGGKGSTWEGGMREPFIAWGPGLVPAGATCDELCCTLDLLPTLARMAGTSEPRDRTIDGADIGPLLTGRPGAATPHEQFLYYGARHPQPRRHPRRALEAAPGQGRIVRPGRRPPARPPTCSPAAPRWCASCATAPTPPATTWAMPAPASPAPAAVPSAASTTPVPCSRSPPTTPGSEPSTTDVDRPDRCGMIGRYVVGSPP